MLRKNDFPKYLFVVTFLFFGNYQFYGEVSTPQKQEGAQKQLMVQQSNRIGMGILRIMRVT